MSLKNKTLIIFITIIFFVANKSVLASENIINKAAYQIIWEILNFFLHHLFKVIMKFE